MRFQTFHFGIAAAALMLCAACSRDIEPYGTLDEPQPLIFTAEKTIGGGELDTRAAVDGKWDGGETVAIRVNGGAVKKYKITSSGGALAPYDDSNTLYRSDKSSLTVEAWYPYSATQPSTPTIETNQSTKEKREASNLMKAGATAVFGSATTLTFTHETAYLKLYLTGEDNKALTAGATVKFIGSTGSTWITAYNEGNGYYSALVAPRTISKGTDFLQVTTSVGTYKASAPPAITLEKGKIYNFNYDLKRSLTSKATVSLSESELEYSGAVQKPTITVKYNGTALTQGTDYTLSWSNSNSSDTGTYTVTITGTGAYIGEVTKTYSIVAIPYITFSAESAQTFIMTLPKNDAAAKTIGTFQYSVNGGEWTDVTSGKTVQFGGSGNDLRLKGTSTYGTASENGGGSSKYCSIISFANDAVPVTVSGDLRTLIAGNKYKTAATSNARFCFLFHECKALTYASNLSLPATSLASHCYRSMFSGCINLKTVTSKLPATTLTQSCYLDMFHYCKALTAAPELPSTSLAPSCYYEMFYYCESLTTAPELPATTLTASCYGKMFTLCKSLTSVKIKATDISASEALTDWLPEFTTTSTTSTKRTIYKSKRLTSLPDGSTSGVPKGWVTDDYYD